MTKVQKLLDIIRDTLNDPDGDRWDDARLIRGINEAMLDINNVAHLLRAKIFVTVREGVGQYVLNNDVQAITRAVSSGNVLEFKDHNEMDNLDLDWPEATGTEFSCLVYDKQNKGSVIFYPLPEETEENTLGYGLAYFPPDVEFNSPYGVVVELGDEIVNEPFGIITANSFGSTYLNYIKKPATVATVGEFIELDSLWNKAIKHYVCGITLRDDRDTQNRQFGNEELQLYTIELEKAHNASERDFTQAEQYETEYRRL